MKLSQLLFACFFIVFSISSSAKIYSASVRLLPAQDMEEKAIVDLIQHSAVNTLFIELSNQHFDFNKTVKVLYGGDEGPLYDPETHQILIPYSFVQESLRYFMDYYEESANQQLKAENSAIDTLLHTLLHEIGHAFIVDQGIAILGKEEDAVDNLATILMIEYVEDGDIAAISAAEMFALESENRPDYYDFGEYIDEHSFDLQRYFATLCLVYGSEPDTHPDLLDELEKDYLEERQDFCIDYYEEISANWHRYLASSD